MNMSRMRPAPLATPAGTLPACGMLLCAIVLASPIHADETPADAITLSSAGECQPQWLPTFGPQPGVGGGRIYALTVFDDGSGSGPAVYAGGAFVTAGAVGARRIAKWDGSSWSPLGSGTNTTIHALAVFDDGSGSGPALYAGGFFTSAGGVSANGIATWDGSSWSALGSGVTGGVSALTVFDDGTGGGPALYTGGLFTSAGGVSASGIAKWDGSSWSALGSGMDALVRALTVFDDGTGGGPALYAGGDFSTAGGVIANHIARWDGSSWSALGSGMDALVNALTVFDDGSGSGPALYAGGGFTTAGGVSANEIAKWDGSSWSALGSGLKRTTVIALSIFDDGSGSGPALYAGGGFATAGGVSANRIAKWDGSRWSALGSGMNSNVAAMTVFDDGSGNGPALYAGGGFTVSPAGDSFVARWQGCAIEPAIPGDVNGDGVVDELDLIELLPCFGLPATPPCDTGQDVNGDGVVNVLDLIELLLNFGATAP